MSPIINPATSNTDGVKSTDRTAAGNQPDMTPVAPGGSTSGSGVARIIAGTNISVSPVTGVGDVTVSASGAGSVTSVATSGRGILATPNPITTTGTINGFDPDTFNVLDYGADRTGATDSFTAIAAAIAAGVALNAPFCLYFPYGLYQSSAATPITLTSNAASVFVRGDQARLWYTDTGTNAGMVITKGANGGTYATDSIIDVDGLMFVSSGNQQAVALTLKGPVTTGSGTQTLNRVTRCSFDSVANDTAHFWIAGVACDDVSNVAISQNKFLRTNSGVMISGTSGATSVFFISDNDFQGGTYGVQANGVGTVANRIEGVMCSNNSFVLQNYAVWFENTNTGGVCTVEGGQIVPTAGAGGGVHALNVRNVSVSAVSIANDGSSSSWIGVELLGDCDNSTVVGCQFAANGVGSPVKGVYIQSASMCTVAGNTFRGFSGSASVLFDTGVTLSNCSNNVGDGGAYTDSGTGDNFNNNI